LGREDIQPAMLDGQSRLNLYIWLLRQRRKQFFQSWKEGTMQASEDFPISLFPDFPGCDGEDFHKEAEVKVHSGFLYSLKEVKAMIPKDFKVAPTFWAEGALED
jgi:hypothetical protein